MIAEFQKLPLIEDKIEQTAMCRNPGRTFLGKRHYFSGIAALTPLTPLTYKQNAVNAFIPTKKTPLTPLTPLAFRLNAVNAVIPEKICVIKKSDFPTPWTMRISWLII